MVRDPWPGAAEPKKLIDRALSQGMTPTVRPAGFKRSGRNWFRRCGDVTHVVNAQASPWNSVARDYVEDTQAAFTLNLGIHLDELEAPGERSKAGHVAVTYCHLQGRVADVMSTGDYWWRMSSWNDVPEVVGDLSRVLQDVVLPFFDELADARAVASWGLEAPPGFRPSRRIRAALTQLSQR